MAKLSVFTYFINFFANELQIILIILCYSSITLFLYYYNENTCFCDGKSEVVIQNNTQLCKYYHTYEEPTLPCAPVVLVVLVIEFFSCAAMIVVFITVCGTVELSVWCYNNYIPLSTRIKNKKDNFEKYIDEQKLKEIV